MASRSKSKIAKSADLDELPLLSQQSSSDDGIAATLVQKIHSGMEKKKKEKEARYLHTHMKETAATNARGAAEFDDLCQQIDQTFDEFLLAYAKADDEIRAIWVKIIKAHAPFTAQIRTHLAAETQQDKEREDQQILGIAYHRKSTESLKRAIASLLDRDDSD